MYKAKSGELKAEVAKADETLAKIGGADPACGEIAVASAAKSSTRSV